MHKKNLYVWILYDFANSLVFINFLLYFSQWMVIDGGLSDFWYNALFAIGSVLLLATAPTLAAFTDRFGGNKHFLTLSTIGTLSTYTIATVLAYLNQSIFLIALFFLFGQYCYQLSFVFYNTLIKDVGDIHHRARASGIGQFANNLGQVMGLVLAIPLSQSRLQPLIPSLVLCGVLVLPMLLTFKESKIKEAHLTLQTFKTDSLLFVQKMKLFFATSIAVPILVAFFFFNDALITVSNNYSIYLERVFAIPDMTKNILLMVVLIMSALGGLSFGRIADKIGTRASLKYILISRILLLPILSIVTSMPQLVVCSALLGFFMGGIWTVTRAYLSQILAHEHMGYGFSFYTLFERFATFIGPLSRGSMIAFAGTSAHSYRMAMMSMTVYVLVGFFIVTYWQRKSEKSVI